MKRLSIAVGLLAPCWGQDSLTLRDAVQRALDGNKAIVAADAATRAADARIAEARSGSRPRLDYFESWTRSDNPVFVFSSLLTQHRFGADNFQIDALNRPDFTDNFQSRVGGDKTLYDGGRTQRAVRLAELGKNATEEETRRVRLGLAADAARAYYAVLLSTEALRATDAALTSAEADLELARNRVAAGVATDAEALTIAVHLAGVKEERIRRTGDLEVARATLNDALGLPLDTANTLSTDLTPLALPTYPSARVAANRPETGEARLARESASTALDSARRAGLPTVALHGAFEADRTRFYSGAANWLVSIDLKWNLFDGGANKARVAESKAQLGRAEAELSRVESAVELQVRRARTELRTATERIATAQAVVDQAEESLRVLRNRYEAGLATVADLLRAETAALETRTRRVAAIHDQRVAAVQLEFAAGTLTPDSEVLQ